jgi:uncharacterized protein
MALLEKLKQASVLARKERTEHASFLVTLYSECAMVGKNKGNRDSTNGECISVIKKFKAGAETIIESAIVRQASGDDILSTKAVNEIVILNKFLPTMLKESELVKIISVAVDALEDKSQKQKGSIMAYLKSHYTGLYDGGQAMRIITQMLD